jgi:carbonic anhydrase
MTPYFLLLTIVISIIFISIIYKLYPSFQTQSQLTAHTAKAFVITCMDFRLIDDAVYFLDSLGYNNNYDEIILAGASLGYNQTKYNSWKKTVDDHINLAKKLHHIKDIIVIDHMDCGAYKIIYEKPKMSRKEEIELHKSNFQTFKYLIKKSYPDLSVSTYLMDIDGKMVDLR